jgi:hypothetical protein
MSLFKDLGKKAKDLLGKGYETDAKKTVKISTKSSDGVTYSAEGVTSGNTLKGKVGFALKHADGLTIKKLELNNSGVLNTEVTLDKAVDNVQFALNATLQPLNTESNDSAEVGVTYTADNFTANLKVSPLGNQSASANVLFKQDDFSAGASVTAGMTSGEEASVEVSGYDFGLGYSYDNSVATLLLTKQLSQAKLGFFRKHSSDLSFAATVTTDLTQSDAPAAPAIEFGGAYIVDADTKIQAKLTAPSASTDNASASFSYAQQLNANAKLTVTSVVHLDYNEPENFFGSDFGVSLAFGA